MISLYEKKIINKDVQNWDENDFKTVIQNSGILISIWAIFQKEIRDFLIDHKEICKISNNQKVSMILKKMSVSGSKTPQQLQNIIANIVTLDSDNIDHNSWKSLVKRHTSSLKDIFHFIETTTTIKINELEYENKTYDFFPTTITKKVQNDTAKKFDDLRNKFSHEFEYVKIEKWELEDLAMQIKAVINALTKLAPVK